MRLRLVLLAVVLLAGCAAPAPGVVTEDAPLEFIDPIVDEHDHSVAADHALWTPGMSLLAHTTLSENETALSYIGEMDIWGDLAAVQVMGKGSVPGFVLVDIRDVQSPRVIGRAEMPYSYVVDVKFAPDGKSVFAASAVGYLRDRSHAPATDDPPTALLTGNGFTQWDISDPTAPRAVAGALAEPRGCHMLSVKELGGQLTVFCISSSVQIFQYRAGGAWERVGALTPGTDAQRGLQQAAGDLVTAIPKQDRGEIRSLEPHDVSVQEDPKQPGRWLALVSYWDFGLHVFDVTDPLRPVELGGWAGEGAANYAGDFHGAAVALLDGKRVILGGVETIADRVPALWLLDAEDLMQLSLIQEWVPPGAHTTQGLVHTTHQFQIVGPHVFLTYNHAGVWVLDLARLAQGGFEEDPARREVLGYYLPHEEVQLFRQEGVLVPDTWDLTVKDGAILATDRYTGLYVLRFSGMELGNATLRSWT